MASTAGFRFGVRDEGGAESSVWRLWRGKRSSDVYLAARTLAGDFKVGLHESGEWQLGLTAQASGVAADVIREKLGGRHMARWQRPSGLPWGVRAFTVYVPTSQLRPPSGIANMKPIHWVTAAPIGYAVAFTIVFTRADVEMPDGEWPRASNAETELVGDLPLPNGERVWLLHHQTPEDPMIQAALSSAREAFNRRPAVLREMQTDSDLDLRCVLIGQDSDGAHLFIDGLLPSDS
jgi:hypothetical protein